jgi:transglutaminase-like putative cysteine protease
VFKSLASCGGALAAVLLLAPVAPSAGERGGTVTFDIRVASPPGAREVKLWFPYPTSDLEQAISDLKFDGNYGQFTLAREPRSGALYLYARWTNEVSERRLVVSFHAKATERRVARLVEAAMPSGDAFPPEVRQYLESSFWLPSDDPKIRALAAQIVAGKPGVLARARAVYDWVLENTRRDPSVQGCGTGAVDRAIAARSGKCADIGSVYVALARAAGVPAREVFGLRLGRPGQTDLSEGHHCWAEFYLPGTGWVPVDPSEVLLAMHERKVPLAEVSELRAYYFGGVDEYRIVLQRGGRGLSFPEGNVSKVNYFMYPYAEVDGKPLDYCRPQSFAYVVQFREE